MAFRVYIMQLLAKARVCKKKKKKKNPPARKPFWHSSPQGSKFWSFVTIFTSLLLKEATEGGLLHAQPIWGIDFRFI
jgi:hypothetical protein